MKILILGNSHSNDTFFQLARVFQTQGYTEPVDLGFLYYASCSIWKHLEFAESDAPVYDFYKSNGIWWDCRKESTLKQALMADAWDIIFLQAAKSDLTEDLNLATRRRLEDLVNTYVPHPHEFAWHTTWPSPNDELFFSKEYWRQPPAGFKDTLTRLYGFNPLTQYTVLTEAAKKSILPDGTYKKAICTGAAIVYATQVLGVSQQEVYRDYTHLSDFGRLIASHTFYAQFTGTPIQSVNVDVIPAEHRQKHYRDQGDFIVTDRMKEIIIKSANWALLNPWTVPNK